MYLCQTELFEIELFICIMGWALSSLQGLYAIKPKQTNKQYNHITVCQQMIIIKN